MAGLFENEIAVDVPVYISTQSEVVHSVERFVLVVVRGNSVDVEILRELYRTETEADQQRDWHQSRWINVRVETVKINVPLPLGTKLLEDNL